MARTILSCIHPGSARRIPPEGILQRLADGVAKNRQLHAASGILRRKLIDRVIDGGVQFRMRQKDNAIKQFGF